MSKSSGKKGYVYLVPDIGEKLQVSHHLYAYSDYLFLLMWVLADNILQGIGSYHLGYQICDYKVFHSPYYHLNVHGICKDACNLCFLSIFIFHSLTTGLSIFFWYLKKQLLILLIISWLLVQLLWFLF